MVTIFFHNIYCVFIPLSLFFSNSLIDYPCSELIQTVLIFLVSLHVVIFMAVIPLKDFFSGTNVQKQKKSQDKSIKQDF